MKKLGQGFKRYMAILAGAAMLAGCAGGGGSSKEGSETAPTALPEMDYDASKASWEQDKTPIELEWFVAYDWAAMNFDPDNNQFDQYVYENTGVKIKFSIGSQEKLNMLIATDSLPDIVTYDAVSSERLALENGGRLWPLDELVEKYAPDMQTPQGMIDWYRNKKDNKWYVLVGYFYDLKEAYERGGYIESHNMNFARKDILEQLGIDPDSMTTKEGFLNALRKVKEANVQYEGQTVIPYVADDAECLAEQFGLDREDSNGNLLNIKRQPEYLEAILFLNQIYREGLTTDEIFTMDNTLRKQMVTSGSVFAGTRVNYLNGKDTLYYENPNALMMGVGHIGGDGGKEAIVSPSPTAGWAATMITKNCKNPARAVSLLSFLTREEISLSYSYGGINGYEIVDGEAVIKPERAEERKADSAAFDAKYRSTLQDLVCDYVWVKKYEPKSGMDELEQDRLHYQKKWVDGHIFDDKIFNDVSPDSGSDFAAIDAQLTSYWSQQFPMMIMAKSPEEAKQVYDNAIAQMDQMGMDKLDAYKNERFQENKKKMGLEMAWPRNQK